MITFLMCTILLFAITIPPAAKVLAVAVLVYAVMQAAKQSPWLSPYLTGWLAVAINVILTILGVVTVTPADQLYTMATLQAVLITVLSAAGIHGTVSKVVMPPKS